MLKLNLVEDLYTCRFLKFCIVDGYEKYNNGFVERRDIRKLNYKEILKKNYDAKVTFIMSLKAAKDKKVNKDSALHSLQSNAIYDEKLLPLITHFM